MAIKGIVKIWDENQLILENIEFLRKKTRPVKFPLSDKSKAIIQDLTDSYKAIPCAGIAANQIGYNESIFVGMARCDDEEEGKQVERMESESEKYVNMENEFSENREIYINPKIYKTNSKSTQNDTEGCLSVPDLTLDVLRYDKIKVRYRNLDGGVVKKPLKGFMSKLFQHELDHLEGNLMLDLINRITDFSPNAGSRSHNKKIESLIKDYYKFIKIS